ncbi:MULTISPECIES: PucR family transcriptional regulator [unclassified Streptomyces]|uniref:PucR family transcriptional regulator n=1 Tax=unclassified Streptomyces TaxID=2593676 RepID=UPI001F03548C|nr:MULTISPECIES: PucR family transcriptional regulator [unclassified Streptomyces]MCH0563705.1 helix-turn-helix domain-containing protein [Streptomyces sp. MUM 2J]MCH0571093.1 helix-turn-helix domain-containing protein [Streptomyces sp. MUM 136J]
MPDPVATPVPPTPPVPLSALVAREDLGLRQIAGPAAADVAVHWAHASEMSDPFPYLLGGELLLTAGVHVPRAAASPAGAPGTAASGPGGYFDGYVSRIVAAGGAALGFGLAPVHDAVPGALVAACEAYGLPLIEVPPRTTFSGVARAVWQLMAQARTAELRRVTEAQQSLAAAAARPDPVPSVLRRLARDMNGRAVLYGPDGTRVAEAGGDQPEGVDGALTDLAATVTRRASATATDTAAGVHLAAYALGAGQGFVLGVAAPHRDPGDHTISSVAAVLLTLLTGDQLSSTGAARSAALVRLLLGATPQEVAPLVGSGRTVVVHARPDVPAAHRPKGTGPAAGPAVRRAPDGPHTVPDAVAASALGAALGSPLVDLADGIVRVLLPDDRVPGPQPGWTLGISAPASPADWPAADTQAARALARARATRAPLLRYADRAGLADLVPRDAAETHARTLLAPLSTASPALAETLRTWLSLHGSWDRTAVALSVHRNTVRQRIARCAALLDVDLDDADVRMDLWFALRRT